MTVLAKRALQFYRHRLHLANVMIYIKQIDHNGTVAGLRSNHFRPICIKRRNLGSSNIRCDTNTKSSDHTPMRIQIDIHYKKYSGVVIYESNHFKSTCIKRRNWVRQREIVKSIFGGFSPRAHRGFWCLLPFSFLFDSLYSVLNIFVCFFSRIFDSLLNALYHQIAFAIDEYESWHYQFTRSSSPWRRPEPSPICPTSNTGQLHPPSHPSLHPCAPYCLARGAFCQVNSKQNQTKPSI